MSSYSLFPVAYGSPIAVAAQKWPAPIVERLSALPRLAPVTPASQLEVRPAPEMVSSGIREMDALTGGLPRGCLTEVCGTASSGRTSLLLATLAAATQRQEACALVDVSDAFDPGSAANAGVNFEKLLWIRCGVPEKNREREGHDFSRADNASLRSRALAPEGKKRNSAETPVEQALRVTDLLLQSGGFGLVIIDLGDVPFKTARRIPLASWFRFQRAVERTPTVLFVVTQAPCAQTCAALLLKVSAKKLSAFSSQLSAKALDPVDQHFDTSGGIPLVAQRRHSLARHGSAGKTKVEEVRVPSRTAPNRDTESSVFSVPAHTQLLDGLHVKGELLRSRLQRKPVRSVTTAFVTKRYEFCGSSRAES